MHDDETIASGEKSVPAANDRQPAEGGEEIGASPQAAEEFLDKAQQGASQGGKGRID